MKKPKNEKWKERALELIREGKSYQSTNEQLLLEHEQGIGGSTYRRFKQEIFPEKKMDAALDRAHEKRIEQKKGEKGKLRANKWSVKKQQEADKSQLAQLINQAVYHGTFKFCRSKELRIEDVNEINLGGGLVATVMYFLPDINLDHPAIVLTTRAILFYIKFKTICTSVREKLGEVEDKTKDVLSGIKEGWK